MPKQKMGSVVRNCYVYIFGVVFALYGEFIWVFAQIIYSVRLPEDTLQCIRQK